MSPALIIRDVSHHYGSSPALSAFSAQLPAGSSCGLIGPDGAGKSTLLGLLAGVKRLQTGQIEVLGDDVQHPAHRRSLYQRIAFMPQGLGHNLYPELSVVENLRFFAELFGLSRHEATQQIDTLLAATDLTAFAERPAGKLSGGMKQKLGLCCALIHAPDLLILDEPTTGVDPLSRQHFWALIERVRANRPQLTLLVATAYMEEAERFEHCWMLDHGKLLAAAPTTELLAHSDADSLDGAFTHFQQREQAARPALQLSPRHSSGEIAIEAEQLSLRFGDFTAVDAVSFRIERGEIFGFLGSNGCGKTTTMKVLTGLLPASEGQARLLGQPVDARDLAIRKRVGFMSQSFSLYAELTVRQNLELHARLFDLPAAEGRARSAALIERFALGAQADEQAGSLPLGVRQRLSLAVAIIHRPEVLILDEPTSGVDPAARDDFWRLLLELSREQGVTIFLSTHFMNEAERCDRISLMHAGRVLACASPAQLCSDYHTDTLEQAFIQCLQAAGAGQHSSTTTAPPAPTQAVSAAPTRPQRFSLKRLWAVSRREALELSRDPVRLGFALLGSLFLMVIFGLGISLDVERLPFAVLDQDHSPQSRAYLEHWQHSRYFAEQPPLTSPAETLRRLQTGELKLAVEIPTGFANDLKAGHQPEVLLHIDGGMPFRAETSRNYARAVHQHYLLGNAERSQVPLPDLLPAELQSRFRYNQDVISVNAIGPGVMALILAFIPAMLTALGVVREKELGSISNFYATPLTRSEFLLGKQLPYLALSFLSLCLLIGVTWLGFGVPLKGSLATLLLGGLAYLLATTSLGLLISAFTGTQIAAILGAMIITTLPTIQFSGLIVPMSSLDGGAQLMGWLFPAGYFLSISVGTFTKALGLAELWQPIVALLGFFALFSSLSLLLLQKQEA